MHKVKAFFDYDAVKKAVKNYYKNGEIDFDKLEAKSDADNCLIYLDLFSELLEEYGVIKESVMLFNAKNEN